MSIKSLVIVGFMSLAVAMTLGSATARNATTETFICGSVRVEFAMINGWHTYTFTDAENGRPVMAKLYAEEISRKNAVEFRYAERWIDLGVMQERMGTCLRITEDTYARVLLTYEDCQEIIEPKDK